MRHDIQLARIPVPTDETQLQPYSADPPEPSPWLKLHRLLRGRYLLAAFLAVSLATLGGIAGYFSNQPTWQSRAYIMISPTLPDLVVYEQVMPMYRDFVQTQARLIQQPRVFSLAMQQREWTALGRPGGMDARAEFTRSVRVRHVDGSSLIEISFTDRDPDVTPVAVNAILTAYETIYEDLHGKQSEDKRVALNSRLTHHSSKIRVHRTAIEEIARKHGSDDLSAMHEEMMRNMVHVRVQYMAALKRREAAEAALQARERGELSDAGAVSVTELSLEQIAGIYPRMEQLLEERETLEQRAQRLLHMDYGEQHTQVRDIRFRQLQVDQQIERYAQEFRNTYHGFLFDSEGNPTVPVSASAIEELKRHEQYLREVAEQHARETNLIGSEHREIQRLRREIAQEQEDVQRLNRELARLDAQQALSGQVQFFKGSRPDVPASDPRRKMAALGIAGGGALPIVLLLLIGLLDARYRYSDDAGSEMSGITLLGILPNLPDRLTDPDQAAIAAHCVHQIRTMLQINGQMGARNGQPRQVFAVTSAAPGDGKTSLTLALGLSFAASGARTLLIDCDLVGAGLTARMNMQGPDGVLEAMASGSLLPYLRSTDVDELAMLPVGSAHAHHASMISPTAMQHLINEARKHFDTILIDTGPIMGSIEASPVASTADGVILAVSRGQQRPVVERAIKHLYSIGANLAGVVFNRAQDRDFDRSLNRMSMMSASRINGHTTPVPDGINGGSTSEFGPVARAVASASSFKKGNGR